MTKNGAEAKEFVEGITTPTKQRRQESRNENEPTATVQRKEQGATSEVLNMQKKIAEMEAKINETTNRVIVLEATVRTLSEENERLRRGELSEPFSEIKGSFSPDSAKSSRKTFASTVQGKASYRDITAKNISENEAQKNSQEHREVTQEEQKNLSAFENRMNKYARHNDPKPKLTALYFKNLPRAPTEEIEEALRELLQNRTVHYISFIGKSVVEVLTETKERQEIAKLMRKARMVWMVGHNIFDNAIKKGKFTESSLRDVKNATMVRTRARHCAAKAKNEQAKEWYGRLAKAANRRVAVSTAGHPRGPSSSATAPNLNEDGKTVAQRTEETTTSDSHDPPAVENQR